MWYIGTPYTMSDSENHLETDFKQLSLGDKKLSNLEIIQSFLVDPKPLDVNNPTYKEIYGDTLLDAFEYLRKEEITVEWHEDCCSCDEIL